MTTISERLLRCASLMNLYDEFKYRNALQIRKYVFLEVRIPCMKRRSDFLRTQKLRRLRLNLSPQTHCGKFY